MRLSELIGDRDNNLNLVRITAALAVLVTHSFALTLGPNAEPLRQHLGTTLGTMAVDVFFVASGFLVTFSLAKRQSVLEFVLARALRILPALFVMLLLSVAVLGPAFTALPLADYFADRRVATYLIKGATLVTGIEFELPGVFLRNPYPAVVNGSLWTLPWEVAMYGLLLLAWIGAKFSSTPPAISVPSSCWSLPSWWRQGSLLLPRIGAAKTNTTASFISCSSVGRRLICCATESCFRGQRSAPLHWRC